MLSVTLKNVSKSFKVSAEASEQTVIDGLNLTFEPGESVALMGPSGSGKSTILNLIAGLDSPTSGEVLVGNADINQMSLEKKELLRLHSISYVFQSFHLLPTLTALENCALVAFEQGSRTPESIISTSLETLHELGLSDAAHKFPSQLSGGMQARVALARALIANPKLVLADEPTGNLDSKTGDMVLEILFREQQKRKFTLLMVTHDPVAAGKASRRVQLLDGRVLA